MDDEQFHNQMRKFLREVGITSQQMIEAALSAGTIEGERVTLRMHLTSEPAGIDHVVEREIALPDGVTDPVEEE
jgi:hypothetical protein